MPIYEYKCNKCHKIFEHMQKISDEPLKNCPDCGCKVKRLVSKTSFALKGSGWYKNGYGSAKSESKTNKVKEVEKPKKQEKKEEEK